MVKMTQFSCTSIVVGHAVADHRESGQRYIPLSKHVSHSQKTPAKHRICALRGFFILSHGQLCKGAN